MILSIIIPVVIYVVVGSLEHDVEDVSGARTSIEMEQDTESTASSEVDVESSTKSESVVESSEDSSSAVVIEEGESSVDINIDNNSSTSQSDSSENSGTSLSEYQYPGASNTSSSSSEIVMQTSDDAETVTSWYENKINEKGMSTQSFVRTSTNGKVLNKLGAAGGGENVLIEISGQNGGGATQIIVKRQ